jgi:cytochrome P450 monooxygenase
LLFPTVAEANPSLNQKRQDEMLTSLPIENTSGTILIVTALLVAFGSLYLRWAKYGRTQTLLRSREYGRPPRYPHKDSFGMDLHSIRMNAMKEGTLFKLYESQFELYGKTFEETLRGTTIINTIAPANIHQVTTSAFEDYCRDPTRGKAGSPFLGPSIFSDGLLWKWSRAMIQPAFIKAEISDVDQLATFVERFLDLIPDDGSTIDVQPLLHRLFLDISMDFLFGSSVDALQVDMSPKCAEFLQAFNNAQRWVGKRREVGWLQRFLWDFDKDWKRSYSTVHQFIDEKVKQVLHEGNVIPPHSSTTPKRYVLLTEMAKQINDPVQLRYQILGVLLPGRDTVSVLIGNVLFQLARHPHIWTKLREISLGLGDTPLTFEKLRSQELIDFKYVVYETLRLSGPAARVRRVAVRDTTLPVGGGPDHKNPVFIPKGTAVVMGTWAIHHDKDIWGDDVQEFKPERWRNRKTREGFLPFLAGPRTCPAQSQTLTQAVYMITRLTQRFAMIENRDPVFEYVEKISMGIESRNGVKIAFRNL